MKLAFPFTMQIKNQSPYSHIEKLHHPVTKQFLWYSGKDVVIEKSLNHQTVLSVDNFHLLSKHRPVQLQPAMVWCLKHHNSVTFHLSGSRKLLCSACQTWPPGPADTGEHSGEENWRWEMIGLDDWLSSIVLTNLLWFVIRLSLEFVAFLFVLCPLVLSPLIIFPTHVDFSFSHHLYPFSLLFHLFFPPLVFLSPSIPIPHIPTGVVIPSPQWRLNDFILSRLCLLLLMMCLVPSYFDADYQSLLVNACVC